MGSFVAFSVNFVQHPDSPDKAVTLFTHHITSGLLITTVVTIFREENRFGML